MLECMCTHTNTYIIHTYHIHRYIHTCIYTCIHIHKVGPVRTGGWGFERQGRRKHACLAAYPVAISPSAYSGSSVCSCLSLVSVHACICHLVSSRSLCFLRHRNMRALQHLPACASGCVRVRTRNWCVLLCAHLSLSLPLSLSTCEYIPALTYTHTHIKNVKGRLQTRGHTRIHSFHGTWRARRQHPRIPTHRHRACKRLTPARRRVHCLLLRTCSGACGAARHHL